MPRETARAARDAWQQALVILGELHPDPPGPETRKLWAKLRGLPDLTPRRLGPHALVFRARRGPARLAGLIH